MKFLPAFNKVSAIILVGAMLSGCASFQGVFETPQQKLAQKQVELQTAINSACNSAPILYSNLKAPVDQRVYFLNSGDICYANS